MGTFEEETVLSLPADDAIGACVAALTRGGFKKINAAGTRVVTAEKKALGQWTKSQVTLVLHPDGKEETGVVVTAQAKAQSLGSLASDPARRLVEQVLAELGGTRTA